MVSQLTPAYTTREVAAGPEEALRRDTEILELYRGLEPWGLATAIDLRGCHPRTIRDAGHIGRFAVALCDLIGMRRFGEPVLVRFDDDPRARGYCLTQLIETSLISGHFVEESESAYIDLLSCRAYPPYRAADFCRRWFGAATARLSVTLRQA